MEGSKRKIESEIVRIKSKKGKGREISEEGYVFIFIIIKFFYVLF